MVCFFSLKVPNPIIKDHLFKGRYKMTRKIVSLLILFVAVGLAGIAYGSTKTTFKVSGLYCGSCLSNIASSLQKVEGALGMEADLRQGLVTVEHEDPLTAEKIAEIISSLGYPAEINADSVIESTQSPATPAEQAIVPAEPVVAPVVDDGAGVNIRRTSLLVKNLSCTSCLGSIEAELKKIKGSLGMAADLGRGIVWVDHRDDVDCDRIARLVTDIGYPAEVDWTARMDRKYAMTFTTAAQGDGAGFAGGGCGSGGCDLSGSGGGCGASSTAWKQLFDRYGSK